VTLVVDDSKESDSNVGGSYQFDGMPAAESWRFHRWIYRNVAYVDHYLERPAPSSPTMPITT